MTRAVSCVLLILMCLASRVACACTLAYPSFPPTNFEMVRMTPTILWARAVSGDGTPIDLRSNPSPDEPPYVEPTVTFEVLEVIKGQYSAKTFTAKGSWKYYEGASDPNSFAIARPGAGMGACVAYDYQLGTAYLLFVPANPKSGPDYLQGFAFSRINEEAPEGSPWLDAVRKYVRIAALKDWRAERHALQATAANVQTQSGDQHPLAQDIQSHLNSPTPFKSFEELLAFYRHPKASAQDRLVALYAMAMKPAPEALPLFEQALSGPHWRHRLPAIATFTENTANPTLGSQLLRRLPKVRKSPQPWDVLRAICASVDSRDAGRMLQLLRRASVNELSLIASWFSRHPSPAGIAALKQRWLFDATDNEATNYALAGLGDPDVLRRGKTLIAKGGEGAWQGVYIVAASSRPEASDVLSQLIASGNVELIAALVDSFSEERHSRHWPKLFEVAAMPARAPKVAERLSYLLEHLNAHDSPRAAELRRVLADASH